MKKRQIASFALASLLAVSTLATASCRRNGNEKDGNKPETPADTGEQGTLVLPELDGNEDTFDVFLAYGVFDSDYIAEEENGDTIHDIIYNRNIEVEDKFNIKFTFKPGNKTSNSAESQTIRSLVQSGDNTYEVFVNVQHAGVPLIYEGLYVEWGESMPWANLDNPWWYQNVQRDLNFGENIYVTAGAYNFHCLKASGCLAFNKTMMDELELEYPYQMVLDGEWTVDKFIEYVKAGQKDLNGDGQITPDADRLGFSGWKWEMVPAIFVGMGGEPVTKNESNLPVLNVNNERTINVIDKMIEIFADGNGAWDGGNTYGVANTMFTESRLLFKDSTLSALTSLRNMEDDFGAVPYPKLDEDQEDYYARIVNFSSLTYIPVTNDKLELTSAVLEYMAYLSYQDLIPAFYDEILTIKTSRDVETEEMIDIIREGARFMDENYLNSGMLVGIIAARQNTISSNYAAQGDAWEAKLEELTEFWSE